MPETLVAPAYLWVPERRGSYGDEAIDLMALAGRDLDGEQRQSVDAQLSFGAGGRWVAFETCRIEPRQNGKALSADTELLTANRGWVSLAGILVGDRVFHPAGHSVAVTYVSTPEFGRKCYRVTTTDGRSVIADAEHLWTVTDKRRARSIGPRATVRKYFETLELTTREMFDRGLSRYTSGGRTSTTSGKKYATNEYRFVLPPQEPLKSPDVDLPVDPYLLGAWLGDGSSKSACLTCHEDEVDYWVAAVAAAGFLPTRRFNHDRAWSVGITCSPGRGRQQRSFPGHLRRLGMFGNKHVPDAYLSSGTAQREALLQGLMDTDGTIEPRRGQTSFCSVSRSLADAVLFLARSLGWRATLIEGRARLAGRDCGPKYSVAFTPKLSDPFRPFRMPRKLARVQASDGGKGRATLSIASIEPVSSVPVRCIKVDSPDGLFVAGRHLVPTHNTGGELQAITFFDLFLMPPDRIVWTAHLFRTAREAFMDAVGLIEGCGFLSKRVKKISYANGEESIELLTGAKLDYLARSKGGGRGLGGKRLVFDEALFLAAEAMGALIPTMAARSVTGDPQLNYAGSAGLATSDHLRAVRNRGRAGGDPSLVYVEHCAPGSWADPGCEQGLSCQHGPGAPGCALDNEDYWAQANHALGRRISVEYIRSERRALPPSEFGRERLGWWDDPDDDVERFLSAWLACADTTSIAVGRPALTLDVSPGSRSAAIFAATRRPDGRSHLELVAHESGVDWLPGRCEKLKAENPLGWALDPAGPAGSVLPDLAAVGIEPHQLTARELGQACEGLTSAAANGALAHLGDPILTGAIAGAGRRDIGDGLWAWSRRKSGTDICPLVAGTEAHWLLSTFPPEYDLLQSFW